MRPRRAPHMRRVAPRRAARAPEEHLRLGEGALRRGGRRDGLLKVTSLRVLQHQVHHAILGGGSERVRSGQSGAALRGGRSAAAHLDQGVVVAADVGVVQLPQHLRLSAQGMRRRRWHERAEGGARGRGGRPHARGASRGRPGSCCCAQRRAGGRVGGQGSLVGGAARLKLRLLALARVHLPDGQLLCHEFQPVGAPSDDRHAAVGACGRRGESGASTCQSVHSRAGEGRGSAGPARRGAHPCRRCARARTLPQTSARRGPSSR